MSEAIPGYTNGTAQVAQSPVSQEEWDLLKQTVLWTAEDEQYLHMAGELLGAQVDAILNLWYGFVASHAHLVYYFTSPDGQPIADYLSRVR